MKELYGEDKAAGLARLTVFLAAGGDVEALRSDMKKSFNKTDTPSLWNWVDTMSPDKLVDSAYSALRDGGAMGKRLRDTWGWIATKC